MLYAFTCQFCFRCGRFSVPVFVNENNIALRRRPPSLSEREEQRLRHGKEYVNLPANYAELHPCYSVGTERAPHIYASFHDCAGSYGSMY